MLAKVLILVCAFAAVFAYPYADLDDVDFYEVNYEPVEYQRARRQAPPAQSPIQLSGGGGGSPKTGYDVNINAGAPVWKSDNGKHEVGVSGGYSQHLGGPYGNSKPDYRGGVGYTYHFG